MKKLYKYLQQEAERREQAIAKGYKFDEDKFTLLLEAYKEIDNERTKLLQALVVTKSKEVEAYNSCKEPRDEIKRVFSFAQDLVNDIKNGR